MKRAPSSPGTTFSVYVGAPTARRRGWGFERESCHPSLGRQHESASASTTRTGVAGDERVLFAESGPSRALANRVGESHALVGSVASRARVRPGDRAGLGLIGLGCVRLGWGEVPPTGPRDDDVSRETVELDVMRCAEPRRRHPRPRCRHVRRRPPLAHRRPSPTAFASRHHLEDAVPSSFVACPHRIDVGWLSRRGGPARATALSLDGRVGSRHRNRTLVSVGQCVLRRWRGRESFALALRHGQSPTRCAR